MKKLVITGLVALMVFVVPAASFAGKVVLPEETEIKVKFDPAMMVDSGKLQAGVTIAIYLAEDIKIGGKTIVEAGAEGTAKVEEAVSASRPGKPGMIKIAFVDLASKGAYATASGEMIKLAGVAAHEGKGRKFLSWLFIAGLFIKGQQGAIDTMLEYPATIGETIILRSD
ncbi:MAG: hypothetical protein KAV42_09260 [Candidatus Krumholzibacteria bacterium]|nr:hypothetical protein [Candidatus Krumholzibacteria bacterium]